MAARVPERRRGGAIDGPPGRPGRQGCHGRQGWPGRARERRGPACGCHGAAPYQPGEPGGAGRRERIVLVGNPNVGKSVLFNALTGSYVTVSNYPGTTVEVAGGRLRGGGPEVDVIDTPGMYSLLPITEEERVARNLLLQGGSQKIVHVVDAKNLERMLPFTLQLIETGLPVILDINIIDEAERLGIRIDAAGLEKELGIPVVTTSAVSGRGIHALRERLLEARGRGEGQEPPLRYRADLEAALREIAALLAVPAGAGGADGRYPVSRRSVALLLLQGDGEAAQWVQSCGLQDPGWIQARLRAFRRPAGEPAGGEPAVYAVALDRQARARELLERYVTFPPERKRNLEETLNWITTHPLTGIPLLALVLYLGLYQFVGVLGAGTLVGFLESRVFGSWLNPLLAGLFGRLLPWPVVQDLFVGEYGILTLGLRYALAIILPIVGTFFLAFSILEDSGYFPRLAMLVDRVFKGIGLNGRAVIPMVLGFGCDTMATMVTRTLETRRERLIATLLLALAIPCSAQLGVILAILSGSPGALLVWGLVIAGVFLLVGLLAARFMPGERPSFYMELPPLRLPRLGNVLVKTYSRMQWYLLEVLPFFLLASVVIWVGRITGLFQLLIQVLKPVMAWIGLPQEAAAAFIFGFFRRDYGAAGLYDLYRSGLLSGSQMVVASVTLTLFLPCVAQLAVMIKERGWRTALAIAAFIFPFAFLAGRAVGWLLAASGVRL